MAPRARRSARAATGHRRPAADRRTASWPDVLAEPDRLRAARGARRRVHGLARVPAAALLEAADDRRHRPGGRRARGRRGRDVVPARGHRRSRAARSRSRPPTSRHARTPTPAGRWTLQVDLRRGENQFRITATDPATGKVAEAPVERVITVPFRVIEAPTLTVDQPADGATYENGAIPDPGSHDERQHGRRERRIHGSGRDRRERPDPGAATQAGAGDRRGR